MDEDTHNRTTLPQFSLPSLCSLASLASQATELAISYSWDLLRENNHWNGELRSNASITAEQIFLYQSLGYNPIPDASSYRHYFLSQQQDDGSWSIAPGSDYPGCVSTTTEVYLALKIMGVSTSDLAMLKAKEFVRSQGGVAKVRIFTRLFLAQFGLWPWDSIPQLPVWFVLLPAHAFVSIYRLASWARSTIIPLLIIRHHEKVYPLPSGEGRCLRTERESGFLDELWLDPRRKNVAYAPSLLRPWESDVWSLFFSGIDMCLAWTEKSLVLAPVRKYARRKCVEWILGHQEKEGDWAGIIPPMHAGVQALLLEGYKFEDERIQDAIKAIERFTWEDERGGKRLQSCVSPVWDTVLMTRALCDAHAGLGGQMVLRMDERLSNIIHWIKSHQLLGPEGDWRIYVDKAVLPGGFSFEYHNTWYPDVDDTAAAILALISQNHAEVDSHTVTTATAWICGLQNADGGWAAFDLGNDRLWLNKIPFSDMDALCDPSSADVTGRVLEAFGLMMQTLADENGYVNAFTRGMIEGACVKGIAYLVGQQEGTGSWYGRWGSNYLYGTSNVLCGLKYFVDENMDVKHAMERGVKWLKRVQNADGGWGEDLQSYRDKSRAGRGVSTPSQTAWALMGLLSAIKNDPRDDVAIERGIKHLVDTQTDVREDEKGASWPEKRYTGTGFPNFFYIGYTLYRHYFPTMALGRYLRAVRAVEERVGLAKDQRISIKS